MVAKFLDDARHDARMYFMAWRIQLRAATKLRGAFALQIVGMMINNVGLLAAWLFLFSKFGTLNGWSAADFIGVQGVNMLIFGITIFFNSGITELPRHVDQGTLDIYLTKPSSILTQVMSSAIEIATVGDILLGTGLVAWYLFHLAAGAGALLLFASAVLLGLILMWCFTLLPFLLAFYMFDSDKVARNIAFFYLDTGIYPTGVLSGGLRTFLLTAFPGMFIGVVPIEVVRDMKWQYLVLGLVVAAFWLVTSLWLFKRSLKKYESANLVGAR